MRPLLRDASNDSSAPATVSARTTGTATAPRIRANATDAAVAADVAALFWERAANGASVTSRTIAASATATAATTHITTGRINRCGVL